MAFGHPLAGRCRALGLPHAALPCPCQPPRSPLSLCPLLGMSGAPGSLPLVATHWLLRAATPQAGCWAARAQPTARGAALPGPQPRRPGPGPSALPARRPGSRPGRPPAPLLPRAPAACSSRPGPALPRSLSASGVEPSLPFGSPEPRPRPRRAQAHSQGSAGRLGAGSQPGREPRQDSRLRRFPPSSLPRPWESCRCGRWSRALSPEPAPGDPDGAPAQPCPWRLWGVTQGMGRQSCPTWGTHLSSSPLAFTWTSQGCCSPWQ